MVITHMKNNNIQLENNLHLVILMNNLLEVLNNNLNSMNSQSEVVLSSNKNNTMIILINIIKDPQ